MKFAVYSNYKETRGVQAPSTSSTGNALARPLLVIYLCGCPNRLPRDASLIQRAGFWTNSPAKDFR
jgi:hypothetical protein